MDVGWSELLLIGIVALIVVGPKDLPVMFHTLGRIMAKIRSVGREFTRAMDDAARESGMNDLQRDLKGLASPKGLGLDKLQSAASKFESWDPLKKPDPPKKPVPAAKPATEAGGAGAAGGTGAAAPPAAPAGAGTGARTAGAAPARESAGAGDPAAPAKAVRTAAKPRTPRVAGGAPAAAGSGSAPAAAPAKPRRRKAPEKPAGDA